PPQSGQLWADLVPFRRLAGPQAGADESFVRAPIARRRYEIQYARRKHKTPRRRQATRPGMQDDQDKREKTGRDVRDSRHHRLKLALRENLKRRKSQARGRSDEAAASSE
ncbi:unnamed protein product, partial [Phaeothamnion confervicola]